MALRTWVRALVQRRRAHRELEDELTFHLEMENEANVARGMPPAAARQLRSPRSAVSFRRGSWCTRYGR